MKSDIIHVQRRLDTPVDPFPGDGDVPGWEPREDWPASWIGPAQPTTHSSVVAYRIEFECEAPQRITVHVTADQRYWLYLDGERIGMGSERGCMPKWFYETYEIELPAGVHTFGTLVWHLTEHVPWAQVSIRPAFLLAATAPATGLLSTGIADWKCRVLANVEFLDPTAQVGRGIGCGARVRFEGNAWTDCFGEGPWSAVAKLAHGNNGFRQFDAAPVWILHPARLPPMREDPPKTTPKVALVADGIDRSRPLSKADNLMEEAVEWQALMDGNGSEIRIPPRTQRTVVVDLGDYLCGYYRLGTRGGGAGAEISLGWAERLSIAPDKALAAPDRLGFDGLFFVGTADEFRLDGGRDGLCEPLWWQAGRWVRIAIETQNESLAISGLTIRETGYPFENGLAIGTDSETLNAIVPLCHRTLRCCAHETYMDCPYWEQLQYAGDVRIGALLAYVSSRDVRLVEKAIDTFQHSIARASPFPAASYPNRGVKIIAPWALCWIGVLHDYALWHGNLDFVRKQLPLAWWIVDRFLLHRDGNGLVRSPAGWNYVDSTAFPGGEPPGGEPGGTSGVLNWQVVLALGELAELSGWIGEPERAQHARRIADDLAAVCEKTFWDSSRSLLADDLALRSHSEHSHTLALLSGRLSPECEAAAGNALATQSGLLPAGPYFTHYVCLALARIGADLPLRARLDAWRTFLDAGMHTCPEHGLRGRSDCHVWSAHPLFHLLHSVIGIRPTTPGFGSVAIAPRLGNLRTAHATLPHPFGSLSVRLQRDGEELDAEITLPDAVTGYLRWHERSVELRAGHQKLKL